MKQTPLEQLWLGTRCRSGTAVTVVIVGFGTLDWPLSDEWLGVFGLFAIVGIAALFGRTMSRTGSVIIAVAAFAMTMIGILYPFLMLASIVALLFKNHYGI